MIDVNHFFVKMREKIKNSSYADESDFAFADSVADTTDKDIEGKYSPVLLYCQVPQTVSLKKRAFIEQQCEKYHIERKKECEML